MKKILFNDYFSLTKKVLSGEKWRTMRIKKKEAPTYHEGEIVAVARSYKVEAEEQESSGDAFKSSAGWNNKLFVKAEDMAHAIKIISARQSRLQNVDEEDCIAEGIERVYALNEKGETSSKFIGGYPLDHRFNTAKEALKSLIERINGKGTWDKNPIVWVYEFENIYD